MVIGLWGIVLLPMWLRNHEQDDEGKQVDRFRRAMVSLQQPTTDLVEASRRKQVQVKRAIRAGAQAPARLTPAARRRRVLAVLLGLQVLALVALPLGLPAVAAAPALLIAAFLVLARSQVRRERARLDVAAPVRTSSLIGLARALTGARAVRRPASRVDDVVEQAPAAPTVAGPASWQPVRTPAPSYLTAPAATAIPRLIDGNGGWTGSAMVEAARAMASAPEPILPAPAAPAVLSADPDITAEIPVIRHTA